MKLLVIRHGECEANVLGVVAGSRDNSPLTAFGVAEAEQAAEKLVGFSGLIVSSPLQRAKRTAEIIRDRVTPDALIRIDPAFIERDVGDATGKPLEAYFELEKAGVLIPHAETAEEMHARVERGLAAIKATNTTTLLVTHNGTYRMLECILQNLSPNMFADIPSIQNGEIRELEL